jgi:tRNA nucleotidyltransferase (CCA-adding enzyme)
MSEPAGAAPPTGGAGAGVLAGLAERPGGPELLRLGREGRDLSLVGGAVRDLLLSRTPRELDVAVAGDASELAGRLAERLGARARDAAGAAPSETLHERFGTAIVEWEGGRIDIAARRAEAYAAPGALPEVRPGSEQEDLLRRDFTINAIAVSLSGPRAGELQSAPGALEDLYAGLLRVLHEDSFIDDPTRLMRLGRYRGRLGFAVEAHTERLAAEALAAGALSTVSGPRLGAELRLALAEADPLRSLAALGELGMLGALAPGLRVEEPLARAAARLLPADGRLDLLLLGVLLLPLAGRDGERAGRASQAREQMFALLDRLGFAAADRERAIRTALAPPALARALASAERASELQTALADEPPEAIALAGALASTAGEEGAAARAAHWLSTLRHVRLQITGEDLLAAGVDEGPEVGERLARALRARLDAELPPGREAELRAALGEGQ